MIGDVLICTERSSFADNPVSVVQIGCCQRRENLIFKAVYKLLYQLVIEIFVEYGLYCFLELKKKKHVAQTLYRV